MGCIDEVRAHIIHNALERQIPIDLVDQTSIQSKRLAGFDIRHAQLETSH
jgi:hypothetical protein